MSDDPGCQVYYLVLSYALLLALLGRLASEQTALAGFTSGDHHFSNSEHPPSDNSGGLAAQIVWGAPQKSGRFSWPWTTALVTFLRIALRFSVNNRGVDQSSLEASACFVRQAHARANGKQTALRLRRY